MSEEFASEETTSEEFTAEDAAAYRAQLINGEEPEAEEGVDPEPEEEVEQEVVDEEPENEPELDPKLAAALAGINNRLTTLDNIEYRLKQTEKRVGSVQNAVQNSKKPVEAPDKEEVAAAAQNDEKWNALKTEYPEWADVLDGIEGRFLSNKPEPQEKVNVDELRDQVSESLGEKIAETQAEFDKRVEIRLVDVMRPGWRDVIQNPDKSLKEDYVNWVSSQDQETHRAANSDKAEDALKVVDAYSAFVAAKKKPVKKETPEQITARRKASVKNAETPQSRGKPIKTKSEEQMTNEEFRASLKRESRK
jgi:hypothetical protein